MRTDPDGTEHPTMSDVVTAPGLQHIAGCQECRHAFPGWARMLEKATDDTARN